MNWPVTISLSPWAYKELQAAMAAAGYNATLWEPNWKEPQLRAAPVIFQPSTEMGEFPILIGEEINMNWLKWIALIIGEGEQIAPIFIHNPQSQKIEGAVVTSVNGLLEAIAQIQAQGAAAKTTP